MKWQRSLPSHLNHMFYGPVFTACSILLPTQHPKVFSCLPLPKLAPSSRNGMTRLRSRSRSVSCVVKWAIELSRVSLVTHCGERRSFFMLQRMSFAEENQHRRGAHNGCGAAGEICANPHC